MQLMHHPDGQSIASLPYARPFTQYFLGTQEGYGKMYPWLHQQAIDELFSNLTSMALTGSSTSCEHMSLARSTFLGGQRFCSYLWSGDTQSRFDVLLQQVTAGVSIGASGISSWTLDIGGFSGLDIDSTSVSQWKSRKAIKDVNCRTGSGIVRQVAEYGCVSALCELNLRTSSRELLDIQIH
jgi:hypothetical protein